MTTEPLCEQTLPNCPGSPCAMLLGHGGELHRSKDGFAWTTGYGRKRRDDLARRRREIETFIHFSPWQDEIPDVPDIPVSEWGTLAWARFALGLMDQKDERHA